MAAYELSHSGNRTSKAAPSRIADGTPGHTTAVNYGLDEPLPDVRPRAVEGFGKPRPKTVHPEQRASVPVEHFRALSYLYSMRLKTRTLVLFAIICCGCGGGGGGNNEPIVSSTAVQATGNPQVAQYMLDLMGPGSALVQFGTDTSYQFHTSPQSTSGGQLNILVAGMKPFTTYHMRAVAASPDGRQFVDGDHVFSTGGPPPTRIPDVTVTKSGLAPNPGIELLDLVSNALGSGANNQLQVAAVDLDGNLIWYYDDPTQPRGFVPIPVKFVADGNLVVNFTNPSPILIPTPGGSNFNHPRSGPRRKYDLAIHRQ